MRSPFLDPLSCYWSLVDHQLVCAEQLHRYYSMWSQASKASGKVQTLVFDYKNTSLALPHEDTHVQQNKTNKHQVQRSFVKRYSLHMCCRLMK